MFKERTAPGLKVNKVPEARVPPVWATSEPEPVGARERMLAPTVTAPVPNGVVPLACVPASVPEETVVVPV